MAFQGGRRSERIKKWWVEVLREFGDATSFHGIAFITNKNYHWSETILWLLIVMLANACAASLIIRAWIHYHENPTVVSIENNFRDWNFNLPAVTGCFVDRMNLTKAHNFITKKWKVEPNTTTYEVYMDFLNTVTNASYNDLENFRRFKGLKEFSNFSGEELADIAHELTTEMEYETGNKFNMDFFQVLTEMGICYTYAGNVSYHLTWKGSTIPPVEIMKCKYDTALCGIRLEEFPATINFYLHQPSEIPGSSLGYYVTKEMEVCVYLHAFETTSSPDIRSLRKKQRKCRFSDEPLPGDKFYSHDYCMLRCKKRFIKKRCGCTPYFYADEDEICDVKGMSCVADLKNEIPQLLRESTQCQCYPNCKNTVYHVIRVRRVQWKFPAPCMTIFQWSMEVFNRIRTKKQVIFGTVDLLVSFGGIAALFLGCSVISFIELVNFFTLRWLWKSLKK